jgi:hypothetical protein
MKLSLNTDNYANVMEIYELKFWAMNFPNTEWVWYKLNASTTYSELTLFKIEHFIAQTIVIYAAPALKFMQIFNKSFKVGKNVQYFFHIFFTTVM